MATVYRVDKSIKLITDVHISDLSSPAEDPRRRDVSRWSPQRSAKSAPAASPVIAMIEPIQRTRHTDEEEVTSGADPKQYRDERIKKLLSDPSYINFKESYSMSHAQPHADGTVPKDDVINGVLDTHFVKPVLPPSVDLESESIDVSSEQSSPGSVCSADSGLGSTQSIADLCNQDSNDQTHGDVLHRSNKSNSGTPMDERCHNNVSDSIIPSESTGTLLKRFIKRNLRLSSENINTDESSFKCSNSFVEYDSIQTERTTGTPEPKPFYKVNVTAHDRIWQKDTQMKDEVSPHFKSLDASNCHNMWSLPEGEPPSDTESESSQDTIIMMTSKEIEQNEQRIAISRQAYDQINLASNATVMSNINIQGGINTGMNKVPHDKHFSSPLISQGGEASDISNRFQVRFDESQDHRQPYTDMTVGQRCFDVESDLAYTSMTKEDTSVKTNYGYLTLNRVPSFRKMNQTFRRPVVKTNKTEKSALEEQLLALTINESDSSDINSDGIIAAPAEGKQPIALPKKRVRFNEIVRKRIVCPPDQSDEHFDVQNALLSRECKPIEKDPPPRVQSYYEIDSRGYVNQAGKHSVIDDCDRRLNCVPSGNTDIERTANVPTDKTRNNVKFKLSRTPSIDRKQAQHARYKSRQKSTPGAYHNVTMHNDPDHQTLDHMETTNETNKEIDRNAQNTPVVASSQFTSNYPTFDTSRSINTPASDRYYTGRSRSVLPFIKDNAVLYTVGNNRRFQGDVTGVSPSPHPLIESYDDINEELSRFIADDIDRIDKLKRRYRSSGDKTLSFSDASARHDVIYPINENDTVRTENRSSFLSLNTTNNTEKQNNDHEKSKIVHGTTADLLRMLDSERSRGSHTTQKKSTKIVRRHSSHISRTAPHYPVTYARQSVNGSRIVSDH